MKNIHLLPALLLLVFISCAKSDESKEEKSTTVEVSIDLSEVNAWKATELNQVEIKKAEGNKTDKKKRDRSNRHAKKITVSGAVVEKAQQLVSPSADDLLKRGKRAWDVIIGEDKETPAVGNRKLRFRCLGNIAVDVEIIPEEQPQ